MSDPKDNGEQRTPAEQAERWRLRYDSMVEATVKQQRQIIALQDQARIAEGEKARLAGELQASRDHVQMLAADQNKAGQEAGKRIQELMARLQEHGIPAD